MRFDQGIHIVWMPKIYIHLNMESTKAEALLLTSTNGDWARNGISVDTSDRYQKAKALVAGGQTIAEACRQVNMAKSLFYNRRSREKKQGQDDTNIIVHPSPKVPATRGSHKTRATSDFVIITNAANLASVLGALR